MIQLRVLPTILVFTFIFQVTPVYSTDRCEYTCINIFDYFDYELTKPCAEGYHCNEVKDVNPEACDGVEDVGRVKESFCEELCTCSQGQTEKMIIRENGETCQLTRECIMFPGYPHTCRSVEEVETTESDGIVTENITLLQGVWGHWQETCVIEKEDYLKPVRKNKR